MQRSLIPPRRKSILAFIARRAGLAVFGCFVMMGSACNQGSEGDRCNPALIDPTTSSNHDECGSGLSCQQPATCAESYCCPQDPSTSTDPRCNGSACPVPDAATNGEVVDADVEE